MTSPAARRRSQFIDAVIDDYAAAHSTPPDADQLELQRVTLDNTLQGGHVAGDLAGGEDVAAIRSLNDAIAADPRVKMVLLPIGDGVSVVQKLGERQ